MERIRNLKLYLIFLLCFSASATALKKQEISPETTPTADQYVIEARQKIAEKDYTAAAILYQKALKLKADHPIARQELKMLLIEAKRQDPEAEFSEVEWALIEEANKERGGS